MQKSYQGLRRTHSMKEKNVYFIGVDKVIYTVGPRYNEPSIQRNSPYNFFSKPIKTKKTKKYSKQQKLPF